MKNRTIYYNANGRVDRFATWINNSKWSWLIPVMLFVICGIIEGL